VGCTGGTDAAGGAQLIRPTKAIATVLTVLFLLALAPTHASASPDTLRRGLSNIINAPLDMVLAPFVGGVTLAENLQSIDDSTGVRLVYALPGWVWLSGLNFGSGAIRLVSGVLECIPGVFVFPFETDIDPLFDPVTDAPAWVEWDNPIGEIENAWVYYNPLVAPFAINFKFGINYTTSEW
jgi:hypothetical protein